LYPEEWKVSRAKEYLSKYPIPLYTGDNIRIMIARYRDRQLRHRIYQNTLKDELNAIIDKAREYSVPVLMVDPRNTSEICPIHKAIIE
jgi:IS605 OrfB family transposase